jgi:DNA-binding PadR family transcriptional regulator
LAFGLVEPAPNPKYREAERSAEPRWLYQLTPTGEAWLEELQNKRAAFVAATR